jgi:Phage integrase family
MENSRLRETASIAVNVTVDKRSREYLTDREVERLIEAAKQNRSGHRDATAILVAYRHGLRASELVTLRWDDIDLATGPVSRTEGSRRIGVLCRPCASPGSAVVAGEPPPSPAPGGATALNDLTPPKQPPKLQSPRRPPGCRQVCDL